MLNWGMTSTWHPIPKLGQHGVFKGASLRSLSLPVIKLFCHRATKVAWVDTVRRWWSLQLRALRWASWLKLPQGCLCLMRVTRVQSRSNPIQIDKLNIEIRLQLLRVPMIESEVEIEKGLVADNSMRWSYISTGIKNPKVATKSWVHALTKHWT